MEVVPALDPESRKALLADRNLSEDEMREAYDGLMEDEAMDTSSDGEDDEGVDDWLEVDNEELMVDLKKMAPESCVPHSFGANSVLIVFRLTHRVALTVEEKRKYQERRKREFAAWDDIFGRLVDAYIKWKHAPPQSPPAANETEIRTRVDENVSDEDPVPDDEPDAYWEVKTIDIWSLSQTLTVLRDRNSNSPALDFIRHGYITKTAAAPTIAVSVRTLELLYRIRQRKASFSIEAFAKVVCDYYGVSTLCILDAFRTYLEQGTV